MKLLQILNKVLRLIPFRFNEVKKLPEPPAKIRIMVLGELIGAADSIIVNDKGYGKPEFTLPKVKLPNDLVSQAFNRGYLGKSSQRVPLQIEVLDEKSKTVYNNCWITKIKVAYIKDSWIVGEQLELRAESVKFYTR